MPTVDVTKKPTHFRVGHYVVHTLHGPGRIVDTDLRSVGAPGGGEAMEMLLIEVNSEPIKRVYVAVEGADRVLRMAVKKEMLPKVIEAITTAAHTPDEESSWDRRFRRYMSDIESNDIMRTARVYGALHRLSKEKPRGLNFGERKLLDLVTTILTGEVKMVMVNTVDVPKMLEAALTGPTVIRAVP